jgi:hypothetical protein
MSLKRKAEGTETVEGASLHMHIKSTKPTWNFKVDYNDHFETPLVAYEDILPVLREISRSTNKSLENVIVYDPYFCLGNMKALLVSIGVKHVINENKDFYKDIKNKTIPGECSIL